MDAPNPRCTRRLRFLRRLRPRIVTATLSLAALCASPAGAQSTASSEREAAEHDRRGHDAVKRADAETARLEFLKSYRLVASPRTLWSLMRSEIDSNRPLEALKHLRMYLADPAADPKKKEQGQGLLEELIPQVGHLRIDVPETAPVTVDGVRIPSEERKNGLDVTPGNHVVEVVVASVLRRAEVDAPAGKETVVPLDLPSRAPPGSAAPPSSAAGGAPSAAGPGLASNDPSPPSKTAERSGGVGMPPTATWILGGVAVAALGAGVAFSLSAQSKKDDIGHDRDACANPNSAECARVRDLDDTGRSHATLGWIAYGGAGAALIAGGLVWVLAPKSERHTARTQIVPMTAPGVAGVRLQTRF
ncbi:hypothetical protein [Pendulispora albinea]|uniref:PEGA domain-containing protein n=1 Tax=Pendulispora albinea TaxID=2741071 RepID=A0ABZ2MBZ6_9BACT